MAVGVAEPPTTSQGRNRPRYQVTRAPTSSGKRSSSALKPSSKVSVAGPRAPAAPTSDQRPLPRAPRNSAPGAHGVPAAPGATSNTAPFSIVQIGGPNTCGCERRSSATMAAAWRARAAQRRAGDALWADSVAGRVTGSSLRRFGGAARALVGLAVGLGGPLRLDVLRGHRVLDGDLVADLHVRGRLGLLVARELPLLLPLLH